MNAIVVDRLCKQYLLDVPPPGIVSFREAMVNAVRAPFRGRIEGSQRVLKALDDVSFEVQKGEVIGIIGPNGAGKSTLLKILSRVTEPTSGSVRFRGRVSSLLEVGTGFHPELTGRENVYVNGAILGMTKSEISKRFDEIVDFSGIKDFIDTPVKRYSSGMRMRLAYSVSAQLDPDIFLIDEALGVGDMEFREKCMTHLQTLTRSGRTVILVSHELGTLSTTAKRLLLLVGGKLVMNAEPGKVMDHYAELMEEKKILEEKQKKPEQAPVLSSALAPSLVHVQTTLDADSLAADSLRWTVEVECHQTWRDAKLSVIVNNAGGYRVLASTGPLGDLAVGTQKLEVVLKDHRLSPAHYSLDLVFHSTQAWRGFTHVGNFQIPRTERTADARGAGVVLGELGVSIQK